MFRDLFTCVLRSQNINILMFVAQSYGMPLSLSGVDEFAPHEGISNIVRWQDTYVQIHLHRVIRCVDAIAKLFFILISNTK
jgi:hypothetical protein